MDPDIAHNIQLAATAIRSADALLIGAGAGMGVDSGLPDFRGNDGFWKAYPPFHGQSFAQLSTPHWFDTDPGLAWGFFGHRLNLYRAATPHAGFEILHRWGEARPLGYFVFTSNVDGQFQKAGFPEDRIVERSGSIRHLQCVAGCSRDIWPAGDICVEVDEPTVRAHGDLPCCPHCGGLARPNIRMFNDNTWLKERSEEQRARYTQWLGQREGRRVVAIELGAGLAIPTVRKECQRRGNPLIRINPRDPQASSGAISIGLGALDALQEIDWVLGS